MNLRQKHPDHLEQGIDPQLTNQNYTLGNIGNQKDKQVITKLFKITKHEKEILCRLKDLMYKTHPDHMEYTDGHPVDASFEIESEHDHNVLLWESLQHAVDAFNFTLKQILLSPNYSHKCLAIWDDGTTFYEDIQDILFGETIDGEFYISLGLGCDYE